MFLKDLNLFLKKLFGKQEMHVFKGLEFILKKTTWQTRDACF